MKKTWIDHVGDFIAGKGFYLILFLCVAAIGISGFYLFSALGGGQEEAAVNADAQVVVTPTPSATISSVAPPVKPSATPSATPSTAPSSTPTPSQAVSPAQTPTATVFTWPVKGELISDFSLEVLAYDETMGDWRTHCGVDIASEQGTQVCAVSAGTVEEIYADDLMGTTVVIDHGDGLRSIYSNLAATPTVSVGDTVSTGSVIGSVGDTALAESTRPSHLHLEMSLDGLAVDPVNYLPQ